MKGWEGGMDFDEPHLFQVSKGGKMEERDAGGHQGGVLEMAGGTGIAPFDGVLGMEEVHGEGEEEEKEKKGKVNLSFLSGGHRIPVAFMICRDRGKVNGYPGRLPRIG